MKKPTVTMMGLGYIGLPTAALIASKGINVRGVDINKKAVDTINQGRIHIVEPDLEGLVKYDIEKGYLKAYTDCSASDVFLIAVPTPFYDDYEPDLSYVENAVSMIIPHLKEGNLVILESTSPVGTTEKISSQIFESRPELRDKLHIAYCPERVLPGKVIYELEQNDRSIGGINEQSSIKAIEFYSLFVKGHLYKTNSRTAEMCKLVENASRDVNIAFANELSIISEKAGINVWELIELANKHPRVNILNPGVGVGGHCIAVDPWFIINQFKDDAKLMKQARIINDKKPLWVVSKIEEIAQQFKHKTNREAIIGCLGLAYKPDIDDLRESPSMEIVDILSKKGYNLLINEPNADSDTVKNYKLTDIDECINKSDILVLLTNHTLYNNYLSKDSVKTKLVNYSSNLR